VHLCRIVKKCSEPFQRNGILADIDTVPLERGTKSCSFVLQRFSPDGTFYTTPGCMKIRRSIALTHNFTLNFRLFNQPISATSGGRFIVLCSIFTLKHSVCFVQPTSQIAATYSPSPPPETSPASARTARPGCLPFLCKPNKHPACPVWA
jgi:hypothetical protein